MTKEDEEFLGMVVRRLDQGLRREEVVWVSPHDGTYHPISQVTGVSRNKESSKVALFSSGGYVALDNCSLMEFHVLRPVSSLTLKKQRGARKAKS